MCIELCSSCFYTSKAFVKPSHPFAFERHASVPTLALESLAHKIQPFTSALATTSIQVINKSFVISINVGNYGGLFLASSQLCLTTCSVLGLLSMQSYSIPIGIHDLAHHHLLCRIIKSHTLSSAKLVAHLLTTAIAKWCKQMKVTKFPPVRLGKKQLMPYWTDHPHVYNESLHIQISASDRRQCYSNLSHLSTLSTSPTNTSYSVSDYAFLTSVSRLGSIGIKVLVLIH